MEYIGNTSRTRWMKPYGGEREVEEEEEDGVDWGAAGANFKYDSIEDKVIRTERACADDGGDDDTVDQDDCEDWERHEAQHEDVTEQDRTKPKLYEREEEVTWEKGGPGLVWYTDSLYWDQTEKGTDTDWRWTDDWDVDFSVYYEKGSGDVDARAAVDMIRHKALESGAEDPSVFQKKPDAEGLASNRRQRKRRNSDSALDCSSRRGGKMGIFEAHTKGVGGRYLLKYGWKPGTGVGRVSQGRPAPVAVDLLDEGAQSSKDRFGFGYRGEKLQRSGFAKREVKHLITTIYDDKTVQDPKEALLRRDEVTRLKHRK